jgi:hypothetical protein
LGSSLILPLLQVADRLEMRLKTPRFQDPVAQLQRSQGDNALSALCFPNMGRANRNPVAEPIRQMPRE